MTVFLVFGISSKVLSNRSNKIILFFFLLLSLSLSINWMNDDIETIDLDWFSKLSDWIRLIWIILNSIFFFLSSYSFCLCEVLFELISKNFDNLVKILFLKFFFRILQEKKNDIFFPHLLIKFKNSPLNRNELGSYG